MMNFIKRNKHLWIIFIALLVSACGQKPYPALPENAVILAFGDSLTYGYNVDAAQSYPAVLQKITGRTVINEGVSGETTSQGLPRFKQLLEEQHVDFIILLEGGNDILQNLPLAQAEKNLAQMLIFAKQKSIPVLLIAVPEKKLLSKTAPFYSRLAETHQVPLMAELVSDLLKQSQYKSDSVHFNAQGYAKMAEEIAKKLKDLGSL